MSMKKIPKAKDFVQCQPRIGGDMSSSIQLNLKKKLLTVGRHVNLG